MLVCLFEDVNKEKNEESYMLSLLNLVEHVIKMIPDASDQLCLNGIAKAMQMIYYDTEATLSFELYKDCSIFIFNLLSSVHSESLTDSDAWTTVTTKLTDKLICRGSEGSFNQEEHNSQCLFQWTYLI
ncbi:hypothetical protein SAY86_016166 [Trapa natans]|uniref:Uncharacterized protein n=1 Tax=Trapa natans TaxID=22666 RepID=A0AAN7LCL1_TRANT|nr:hypothetical protein SAY86_016166 [Trapa natans]